MSLAGLNIPTRGRSWLRYPVAISPGDATISCSREPKTRRRRISSPGCSRPRLDMRHRFDQLACVSGLWVVEQRPALALLDDAAVAQNDGVIAHHANHVEVVTNEEQGEVIRAPQSIQQL